MVTTLGRSCALAMLVLAFVGVGIGGACSSKTSSSARVDGTVDKIGLSARSAVGHGGLGLGVQIAISNKPNTCEAEHGSGAVELLLTFPGRAILASTYDAGAGAQIGEVEADFVVHDASCNATIVRHGTGGTVTITAAAGNTASGNFDLLFGVDHIGGEFSALLCPDASGEGGISFAAGSGTAPSTGGPLGRLDGGTVNDPEAGVVGNEADASASTSTSTSTSCVP